MPLFAVSRPIPAPVSEVYAVLAAVDRTAEWSSAITEIEMLDPLPVAEGTRFRETRAHGGRAATVEMTVTALVPDELIEIECVQRDMLTVSRWIFEPDDFGTIVRFEMEMSAERLRTRIAVWFLSLVLRGVMRRCVEDDLDDLCLALAPPEDSPADSELL